MGRTRGKHVLLGNSALMDSLICKQHVGVSLNLLFRWHAKSREDWGTAPCRIPDLCEAIRRKPFSLPVSQTELKTVVNAR